MIENGTLKDGIKFWRDLGVSMAEMADRQHKWGERLSQVKLFFQPSMTENSLIEIIKPGELFGVVDCSLEFPEEMYSYFEDFPPGFKNCEVLRDEIGVHMKRFAGRNKLLPRPRKKLIPVSSLNEEQLSQHFCYSI